MILVVLIITIVLSHLGNSSDLENYFHLIDLNEDGRVFKDELFLFFHQFYEEDPDLPDLLSPDSLTKQEMILHHIIKRYNRRSKHDYLSYDDLKYYIDQVYGEHNSLSSVLNPFEPEQVHLSYTHNLATEMFISFVTRDRPSHDVRPVVKYCEKNCIAIGETTTYNVDNWHYWIHSVYIRDLQPGTTYNYKLGFIESDNVTIHHIFSNKIWSFKTIPSYEHQTKEIVYIYGDMGTIMPFGFEVMKSIIKDFNENPADRADYVVHVGDIAYAGTGREMEIQAIWDLYMNQISPIASQIPYMTATGNHEKYFNYTSYKTRFFMPSKTNPYSLEKDGNFYFSLETNYIQWIFISTEHDYTPGSLQRNFLETTLKNFQNKWGNKERPWLIVVGHRPMYSSDQDTDSGRLQVELEPLIVEFGVDLAVWGHMHCYERTTPVKFNHFTDREHFSSDGKIYHHNATDYAQTSPIHLTIGTAGADIREKWIVKPEWSQTRYLNYGFGKIIVHNRTHLQFHSILVNQTAAQQDEDSFMIIRQF